MKLKTNNVAKKSEILKKNKSPKKQGKQGKGVEIRKEKPKVAVKPSILKKEGEKVKEEASPSSLKKSLQQELWSKAISNVSTKSSLSEEESCIVKLLANYKTASIPQKKIKFKNFITKGFAKYKDVNDEILNEVYDKLQNEYKVIGGNVENVPNSDIDKSEKKIIKKITKKEEVSDNEEEIDIDEDEDDDDSNEVDDDNEGIEFGVSDDDIDEESEEEKPKPKAKVINKNNKNQPKFKASKGQKKKTFGKKK